MAGVSADYLRRLEQGRVLPSDTLLDALARVLALGPAERAHLQALADRARGRQIYQPPAPAVRPSVLRTVEALAPVPAVVLDRCCEVLAWTPTGALLDPEVAVQPPGHRNVARRVVLEASARALYPEWEALVQEVADVLRLNATRFPDDSRLADLVDELLEDSEPFRQYWERLEVFEKSYGRKVLDHPMVGRLDLSYEALEIGPTSGQALVVYTAEPGSATETALDRLALIAAEPRPDF